MRWKEKNKKAETWFVMWWRRMEIERGYCRMTERKDRGDEAEYIYREESESKKEKECRMKSDTHREWDPKGGRRERGRKLRPCIRKSESILWPSILSPPNTLSVTRAPPFQPLSLFVLEPSGYRNSLRAVARGRSTWKFPASRSKRVF